MDRDFTKKKLRPFEQAMEGLLFVAAVLAVGIVAGILYVVISEAAKFFIEVSPLEFVTSTQWTPLFDNQATASRPC